MSSTARSGISSRKEVSPSPISTGGDLSRGSSRIEGAGCTAWRGSPNAAKTIGREDAVSASRAGSPDVSRVKARFATVRAGPAAEARLSSGIVGVTGGKSGTASLLCFMATPMSTNVHNAAAATHGARLLKSRRDESRTVRAAAAAGGGAARRAAFLGLALLLVLPIWRLAENQETVPARCGDRIVESSPFASSSWALVRFLA